MFIAFFIIVLLPIVLGYSFSGPTPLEMEQE